MSNENRSISLLLTLKGVRTNESSLTEGRCANIQVILGFSYARDMVETPLLRICGYYSVFCKRFFLLRMQCWSAKFCLIGYCLCLQRQRYMPVVQRLYVCRRMTIYPMFIKNESRITFSILRHMLILTLPHLGFILQSSSYCPECPIIIFYTFPFCCET